MVEPEGDVPPGEVEAALLRDLAAALGPDPAPDGMIERTLELLTVLDLDAELIALLQEPSDAEVAGTRGDAAAPMTFVAIDGSVTIEVDIDHEAISGQLIGFDAHTVALERTTGASVAVPVDALGRFRITGPAVGPVRLRVRGLGTAVSTDWFLL